MSETVKRILALVGAVVLVAGAVVLRRGLDDKKADDALVLRLVCATDLAEQCRAAAAADPRVKLTVAAVDATYKKVGAAANAADLDLDAWATIGPWAAMAQDTTTLFTSTAGAASTPVELAGFGAKADFLRTCAGGAAACTAKGAGGSWASIGGAATLGNVQPYLGDVSTDGVALVGLARIVLAGLNVSATDLDRGAIDQSDVVVRLKRAQGNVRTSAQAELSGSKGGAGAVPVAATAASLQGPLASRILPASPTASAVAQVAVVDPALKGVAEGFATRLGAELAKAGWTSPAASSSGLPDPGVLAALREAWIAA